MRLSEAVKVVNNCWSAHSMPDFESVYEAVCGAFIRREAGPISPRGMEVELREVRLKLILLRYASCDPVASEAVFDLGDVQKWPLLPSSQPVSRRAFYSLRETNSSMTTNGPSAAPKTYSFGPWFEPFRRHVERAVQAPYGLGFRRLEIRIDNESRQPQVEQTTSSTGEVTDVRMDHVSLVKRIRWIADHAKEFKYDQISIPASLVAALAQIWTGGPVEVVSTGTSLLGYEAELAKRAFGSHVVDCMRSWDGGVTFTTLFNGKRHLLPDYFQWAVADGIMHTVDLFNHARPFVNHICDDEIAIEGDMVTSIRKPFETLDGIDISVSETMTESLGFWQVMQKAGQMYAFPQEAATHFKDATGRETIGLAGPVGIGTRCKLYRTADLDVAKNHTRLVPAV